MRSAVGDAPAVERGEAPIVIEYAVRAASPCSPPQRLIGAEPVLLRRRDGGVSHDPHLQSAPGAEPVRRQRVSAAVLVVADVGVGLRDSAGLPGPGGRCVLGTCYSGAALRWAGTWGLPGGGVDPGEEPADAARREAHEETGQDVAVEALAFVQSAHWVGRSPAGVVEDFHAVRLVYRGRCDAPGDVLVHDVGGTTAAAAWVPVTQATVVNWAPGPREQLQVLGVLPAG